MVRKVGYYFGEKEYKCMYKKKIYRNVDVRNFWEVGFCVTFFFFKYYFIISRCYFGYKKKNKVMKVIFRGKELFWVFLIY